MAKVMENCLEKLSSLLDSNETHLNGEISIEHENVINASNENNSCSSTIKFEHILMSKSNRFKVKNLVLKNTLVKSVIQNVLTQLNWILTIEFIRNRNDSLVLIVPRNSHN
jgi:hypothetical protein